MRKYIGRHPLSGIAFSFALLSTWAIVLAQNSCFFKPPMIIRTDETRPTWVFSWTKDKLAVDDPVAFIRQKLDYTNITTANIDDYCELFKTYMNSTDPKQKESIEIELRDRELHSNRLCGHGYYFAQNPIASTIYGSYLLAIAIPPQLKLGAFMTYRDVINMTQLILSPMQGIVYQWFTEPALVLRGFSDLQVGPSQTITAEALDLSNKGPKVELWDMMPYTEPLRWQTFLPHFGNYLADVLAHDTFLTPSGLLTDHAKLEIMSFQWIIQCNSSQYAIKVTGSDPASFWMVADAITSETKFFSGNWDVLIKLLFVADYVDQNALKLTPGDLEALQANLVAHFDVKDSRGTALTLIRGLIQLKNMEPRISTWLGPQ